MNLRVLLCLVFSVLLPSPGRADDLRLRDDGTSWSIRSPAIEAVIDHQRNYLRSLRAPGGPELMAAGGGYWDIVFDCPERDLSGQYSRLGHHVPVVAEVLRADENLLHLCVRTDTARHDPRNPFHAPLLQEAHYVFKRDLPGFYLFIVLRHHAGQPALRIAQAREVLRCDPEVFDAYRLSDERAGMLAPWEQFQRSELIADATHQLPDGRIVTKYMYSRTPAEGPVWGLTSTTAECGIWVIEASSEYRTGGPTKQDLSVQDGALLLNEPLNGHYVGPEAGLEVSGDWAKVYGPWLYYLTSGDPETAWNAATTRAAAEGARWPYEWCAQMLGEQLYPQRRAAVNGRVVTSDGAPAAGAWVILARPGSDWQTQSDGYRFWAQCDADGHFRLADVRPGRYALSAWRAGNPLAAGPEAVTVGAENIEMAPVRLPGWGADVVWQIGDADRSAREFHRGDHFRQWNVLRFYPEDFPRDVSFSIGRSEARHDWNIVQPGPTVLDDGSRVQHPWAITFDLDEPLVGMLTLGIADSSYHPPAGIVVTVNGQLVDEVTLAPGDSAAYRAGAWGRYQVAEVAIPAGLLRAGGNVIELNLPRLGSWVMYDFVALRRAPE